ncbi:MAG: hypothetical protein ACLSAH_16890 [Bilophila wadsworthia]
MVEDLLAFAHRERRGVYGMETVKAASILSDVTTACQPQTAAQPDAGNRYRSRPYRTGRSPLHPGRFSATSSRTPAATL